MVNLGPRKNLCGARFTNAPWRFLLSGIGFSSLGNSKNNCILFKRVTDWCHSVFSWYLIFSQFFLERVTCLGRDLKFEFRWKREEETKRFYMNLNSVEKWYLLSKNNLATCSSKGGLKHLSILMWIKEQQFKLLTPL